MGGKIGIMCVTLFQTAKVTEKNQPVIEWGPICYIRHIKGVVTPSVVNKLSGKPNWGRYGWKCAFWKKGLYNASSDLKGGV